MMCTFPYAHLIAYGEWHDLRVMVDGVMVHGVWCIVYGVIVHGV